jgi:drug/metabolite transporter (DMT)-like permease
MTRTSIAKSLSNSFPATSPLIVIALGVWFLGEKAGLARWLAVGAGFAGVLLIIQPGLRSVDWPVLLPLGGSVLWATYQILTRLAARLTRGYTDPALAKDDAAIDAFLADAAKETNAILKRADLLGSK